MSIQYDLTGDNTSLLQALTQARSAMAGLEAQGDRTGKATAKLDKDHEKAAGNISKGAERLAQSAGGRYGELAGRVRALSEGYELLGGPGGAAAIGAAAILAVGVAATKAWGAISDLTTTSAELADDLEAVGAITDTTRAQLEAAAAALEANDQAGAALGATLAGELEPATADLATTLAAVKLGLRDVVEEYGPLLRLVGRAAADTTGLTRTYEVVKAASAGWRAESRGLTADLKDQDAAERDLAATTAGLASATEEFYARQAELRALEGDEATRIEETLKAEKIRIGERLQSLDTEIEGLERGTDAWEEAQVRREIALVDLEIAEARAQEQREALRARDEADAAAKAEAAAQLAERTAARIAAANEELYSTLAAIRAEDHRTAMENVAELAAAQLAGNEAGDAARADELEDLADIQKAREAGVKAELQALEDIAAAEEANRTKRQEDQAQRLQFAVQMAGAYTSAAGQLADAWLGVQEDIADGNKEASLKVFKWQQASAVAQAVIAAAVAGVQAFAQLGPIGGAISLPLIAAQLAVTLVQIKRQQPPQFLGGATPEQLAAAAAGQRQGGGYRQRPDEVLAALHPPEAILNAEGVRAAGGEDGVARLNRGQASGMGGVALLRLRHRVIDRVMLDLVDAGDSRVAIALAGGPGPTPRYLPHSAEGS